MSDELARRAFTTPSGATSTLSQGAIDQLNQAVPDWTIDDDGRRIERRYRFSDFGEAFRFATRIAGLSEEANHHPELGIGWGYVIASLQTHQIGGLHENDFIMAARFDEAYRDMKG